MKRSDLKGSWFEYGVVLLLIGVSWITCAVCLVTLNYTRASSATDVTVHAYWTGDLSNPNGWSNSGVTETMLSDNGTIQQWQATVPVNTASALFMHLEVTGL